MSLDRFHRAQASGFEKALAEIRASHKRSHWIWYIFPQIAGLGRSSTAQEYALRDLAEACAYLRDPLLFARYREITATAAEKLAEGTGLERLMGSEIDARKFVSSLTLFRAAASGLDGEKFRELAALCETALQAASSQGHPPCQFTLQHCSDEAN